jgi:hypothetical protein
MEETLHFCLDVWEKYGNIRFSSMCEFRHPAGES